MKHDFSRESIVEKCLTVCYIFRFIQLVVVVSELQLPILRFLTYTEKMKVMVYT